MTSRRNCRRSVDYALSPTCNSAELKGTPHPLEGLATLTQGIAPLVLVVFSVGVATANANAMNLYCGALLALTFGQTLVHAWSPGAWARTVSAFVLLALALAGALLAKSTFLANYTNFILLMLYVPVPWTAINLVDYYLLRHGHYDVESFFRHDGGIYGRVNGVAVACYLIGILVQLPFVASPLFTGPMARWMGDVDLSWVVAALESPRLRITGSPSVRKRAATGTSLSIAADQPHLKTSRPRGLLD